MRPLVVVTRAQADADALLPAIEALGAEAVAFACIEQVLCAPDLHEPVLMRTLPKFAAVAFASRMAVAATRSRLEAHAVPLPSAVRLAAVGPATAALVRRTFGREPLVPPVSDGEHLLEALLMSLPAPPQAVLLPMAVEGRPLLHDGLLAAGHRPHRWPVYETRLPSVRLARAPWVRPPRYLLFGSPSAVEGFRRQLPWPVGVRALSIGPSTSEALSAAGLPPYRQAHRHDKGGLVDCLRRCLEEDRAVH